MRNHKIQSDRDLIVGPIKKAQGQHVIWIFFSDLLPWPPLEGRDPAHGLLLLVGGADPVLGEADGLGAAAFTKENEALLLATVMVAPAQDLGSVLQVPTQLQNLLGRRRKGKG